MRTGRSVRGRIARHPLVSHKMTQRRALSKTHMSGASPLMLWITSQAETVVRDGHTPDVTTESKIFGRLNGSCIQCSPRSDTFMPSYSKVVAIFHSAAAEYFRDNDG